MQRGGGRGDGRERERERERTSKRVHTQAAASAPAADAAFSSTSASSSASSSASASASRSASPAPAAAASQSGAPAAATPAASSAAAADDGAWPTELGFTSDEMAAAVRVLDALRRTPLDWLKLRCVKPLRAAGMVFVEGMHGRYFSGQKPEDYQRERAQKMAKGRRRARNAIIKAIDEVKLRKREMRAKRVDALDRLTEAALAHHPALLAGPNAAAVPALASVEHAASAAAPADAEGADAATGTVDVLSGTPFVAASALAGGARPVAHVDDCLRPEDLVAPEEDELTRERKCYICKALYTKLHEFYDALCPRCAELNMSKRNATADLTGMVALVTGGRIKIGYHIVLRLLRCGCTVVNTTRFPHDAAMRFAREDDFESWKDRLHIVGVDLRDIPAVERLAAHINTTFKALHIVINNAAQTVRKPPEFYSHLIEGERAPLDPRVAQCVMEHVNVHAGGGNLLAAPAGASASAAPLPTSFVGAADAGGAPGGSGAPDAAHADAGAATGAGRDPRAGASAVAASASGSSAPRAAMFTQVRVLSSDGQHGKHEFPEGELDEHAQQVDLRSSNSWRMLLHEIPTLEMIECQAVNAIAPFVLVARLRRLMTATPGHKFVVNVSAMEGKFYRHKTPYHAHTNMAKAAMNMMTRTAAQDYVRDGIYMSSVDTGWVTNENAAQVTVESATKHGFLCPIDEIDGMARVLDPIFVGLRSGKPSFGHFWKDYARTEW